MNHPTLEALIEGEDAGSGALDTHLASCPTCSEELRALRQRRASLQALPAPVRRARPMPRRNLRRRVVASAGLALAATLAAFILWPRTIAVPRPKEPPVYLLGLINRSQDLESDLRGIPEPSVVDVGDADARAEVEDEIAWVDQCIAELSPSASDDERASLWKTRIGLLESLIKLRRSPPVLVRL
jgi:hypothetical protein